MIRIYKSMVAPAILTSEGITATNALNAAYTQHPEIYTSVQGVSNKALTKMEFRSDIYGDKTVKAILIQDQHEKCCFCENKFKNNSSGDVEHFRPKGVYQKVSPGPLTYPGYYWLAYEWTNLLFSCEICNRSYKSKKFPLQNETTRKPYHNHPNLLENEDPFLIDPNSEDPSDFITFKEEVPIPLHANVRGQMSIRAFGLERMNNERLEYILLLEGLLAFKEIDPLDDTQVSLAIQLFNFPREKIIELIANANYVFDNAAKDSGRFAHCVRCKFRHLPQA